MVSQTKMQNKSLEALKAKKNKSAKAAFSKTQTKSKTPLAGIALSSMLKMNKIKPKK